VTRQSSERARMLRSRTRERWRLRAKDARDNCDFATLLKRRRDTLRRDRRATGSLYGADIDVQMIESVARARVSVVDALET
jgi:hypothetical protein